MRKSSFVLRRMTRAALGDVEGEIPAVKGTLWSSNGLGTRWSRFGLRLKFVYFISLTKEYIMDSYGTCTISYQTHIFFRLGSWWVDTVRACLRKT